MGLTKKPNPLLSTFTRQRAQSAATPRVKKRKQPSADVRTVSTTTEVVKKKDKQGPKNAKLVDPCQALLKELFSHSTPLDVKQHDVLLTNLDETCLNKLLQFCKADPVHLKKTLTCLMSTSYLRAKALRDRAFALALLDILFRKSSAAREFLAGQLFRMIQYTIAPEPMHHALAAKKLPGPLRDGIAMQTRAVQVIVDWYQVFSKEYFQLSNAIDYLHHTLKLDIPLELKKRADQVRDQQRLLEKQKQNEQSILHQWSRMSEKLQEYVPLFEASLRLLFNSDLDIAGDLWFNENATVNALPARATTYKEWIGAFGLGANTYTLDISVPTHRPFNVVNVDASVIDQVKEYYRLVSMHYLPTLYMWAEQCKDQSEIQAMYQKLNRLCEFTRKLGIDHTRARPEASRDVTEGVEDSDEEEDAEFELVLPFN